MKRCSVGKGAGKGTAITDPAVVANSLHLRRQFRTLGREVKKRREGGGRKKE